MEFLVTGTVEVSLLVLGAFAVTALLRRAPAAARHWVLAAALAGAAAMPALERVAPAWPLRTSTVAILSTAPEVAPPPGDATPIRSLREPVRRAFRANATGNTRAATSTSSVLNQSCAASNRIN